VLYVVLHALIEQEGYMCSWNSAVSSERVLDGRISKGKETLIIRVGSMERALAQFSAQARATRHQASLQHGVSAVEKLDLRVDVYEMMGAIFSAKCTSPSCSRWKW
jgi:hypothetical protein